LEGFGFPSSREVALNSKLGLFRGLYHVYFMFSF
jgi:hypothetical protein